LDSGAQRISQEMFPAGGRAAAVVPRSRLRKLAYPAATFRQNPLKASLLQSHRNSIPFSQHLVKVLDFIASRHVKEPSTCEYFVKNLSKFVGSCGISALTSNSSN
jgi:hypothetical protein